MVPIGDPLLEIGDPARMEIVADLLSTDAVRVPPGAPVIIEQWGGSRPLHGRVRRVEPSGFMKVSALGVEEQRVNVLIDLAARKDPGAPSTAQSQGETGPENDATRPAPSATAIAWKCALSSGAGSNVLKVPVGSLFRRGEAWGVFVVEGGRVRLQPVQLGQRNEIEGQVTSGLSEGQTVVMHPPDTLTDGMRVTVRAE